MSGLKIRHNIAEKLSDEDKEELLSRKISEMSLSPGGTFLEVCINQLYQELSGAGISFRPKTYLTDGWGCPNRVPVIGIPFYLADPKLCSLEEQLGDNGIDNDPYSIMRLLRHEAGHAFNYAYRLYRKPRWRHLFGNFSKPYNDYYKTIPFSASFVRHAPGWYAQKHPDDDFAETFAVWLTPDSEWQKWYANTPAEVKLIYIDEVACRYGHEPPPVVDGRLDMPVQEMIMTLDEWYQARRVKSQTGVLLHHVLDNDLRALFSARYGTPVADIISANRKTLVQEVHRWTGMNRKLVNILVGKLLERIEYLGLKMDVARATEQMVSFSAFITTLVMNYFARGKFVDT